MSVARKGTSPLIACIQVVEEKASCWDILTTAIDWGDPAGEEPEAGDAEFHDLILTVTDMDAEVWEENGGSLLREEHGGDIALGRKMAERAARGHVLAGLSSRLSNRREIEF